MRNYDYNLVALGLGLLDFQRWFRREGILIRNISSYHIHVKLNLYIVGLTTVVAWPPHKQNGDITIT